MIGGLALAEQALDFAGVARVHVDRAVKTAGTGRWLGFEQVLTHRLLTTQLAASRFLEALLGGL